MSLSSAFSLALSCVLALTCWAFAYGQADDPPEPSSLIHFGDVVDVDVIGSFEFDWRGGLNPEGFLEGPERLTVPVFARCRTENEVAEAIRAQFGKFLRDPQINVRIVDRTNRALAYINGAVRTPYRLQLRRPATLKELVVLAGGITDASNGEIVVFRPPNVNCRQLTQAKDSPTASDAPNRISIKVSDLLAGTPGTDVTVLSGDIVDVVEAAPVFVTGDVAAPRRMNLTPNLTLSRAVSAAGGSSLGNRRSTVRVLRRRSSEPPLEFELHRILRKEIEDPKLEPYDVIEVFRKGAEPVQDAFRRETFDSEPGRLSRLPLRIVD